MGRIPLSTGLAALFALAQPALAFDHGNDVAQPPWRNQGGSLNYAPRPGVYLVAAVDDYARTVRLRARNGAEADVFVDDRILDVAALKPGDLIQVDFFVPDEPGDPLAAAKIWQLR